MDDEEITEDVDDPLTVEEIESNVEVPIIQISTECDKGDGSVEYVKIVPSELVDEAVVTLSHGTIQIGIPVSQGKLQNDEQSTEANTVVQIGENKTIILNENGTYVGSPFFMLDDGLTFIRAFNNEECVVSDQVSIEKRSLEGTKNYNKPTKKKGKSHYCKVAGCGRVYSTLHHLKVHARNHSGDRPFKCTVEGCSKAFNTDYSRKAHLRTHTGEKPYSCPSSDCRKSFKASGDLQKHIRIHTGERPFLCPVNGCNRSFTTSNIRKVHVRTHTGEKPYECTYEGCSRSFASSTNFKNHMRIHSGEKPYCCPMPNCLKRFTEYSSLYKHQLVHCQLKRHPCQYCHKTYRQSSTLVTHKRTNHGLISAEDGTEIILEQMIGVGEDGTKNFKNITSKLLNLKNENDPLELTVEEENAPLYIISEFE